MWPHVKCEKVGLALVPDSGVGPEVPRMNPYTEARNLIVKNEGVKAWLACELRRNLMAAMSPAERARRRLPPRCKA